MPALSAGAKEDTKICTSSARDSDGSVESDNVTVIIREMVCLNRDVFMVVDI